MKRRYLFLLFIIGLIFNIGIAWFQHAPGYMDADYYYAGGLRLVQGHGFTESYLWNYLDNPQSLPHPSHGYWFPLASIVAFLGMFLTGQHVFSAARLGFIFVAALVAPVSAFLSYRITSERSFAYAAGLLAVFSGYHAPFMPTTDNFGIFMLLGGLFFIILMRPERFAPALLGLVTGLMNLSRVDGLVWFAIGGLGIFIIWLQGKQDKKIRTLLISWMLFTLGYFVIMGPWMARNISIWGTPLTPAGSNVLWMRRYDDTFAWPATRVNMQSWLAAGWASAIQGRLNALKLNSFNTIGAQSSFLLFPFILIGLWALRKDLRIRLAVLGWLILFVVMSIIFPFAGSRGSFFHAAAALQTVWFTASVVGVDVLVAKARAQGHFTPDASQVFRVALVFGMAIMTLYLAYIAIFKNDWNQFQRIYQRTEEMLAKNGAQPADVVIVANAPGYFVTSGRSAIIVPDENLESVHALADKIKAKFLVLEKTYYTDLMIPVYKNPYIQPGLRYLGEFDEVRVFRITH